MATAPSASLCTPSDIQSVLEQHATIDATIMGKLTSLTLAQKTKLVTEFDAWIAKL